MTPAVWVCSLVFAFQPPVLPQPPIETPQTTTQLQTAPGGLPPTINRSGPPTTNFSTGVFPFGATTATIDARGEVSVDLLVTETVMQTATRTVPIQGPDGTTQYKTEQYVVPATVFKIVKRALPTGVKLYRKGREISAEEKTALKQPTPIFIAMLGVSNAAPSQGYEKVVGDALVAFIPPQGFGTPATGAPVGATTPVPAPPKANGDVTSIEKEVVEKANQARAAAGLPALKIDPTLMKAARQHSANMAKGGKLDHRLDGKGPSERLADLGVRPTFTGENCAQGQHSASEAFDSWMNSPEHRGNMLNPSYTHIGVGKADGGDGPYWTQVFARMD